MHVMKIRTSTFLVPFALCAIGCCALVFQGCKKEPEKPVPSAGASASYMKDPVFRKVLAERAEGRKDLLRARTIVVEKMKAMIDAKKAELKTDDLEKVRVGLEKDPEWNSLYKRCLDVNQALEEQRKGTLGVVRARIAPERKPVDGKISK